MRGLLLCAAVGALYAAAPAAAETFYSKSAEGWFWYRDPPPPAEEIEPEPPPPAPPPVVEAPKPPPPPAPIALPEPEGPQVGSVAWLRSALPAALDTATDDPTPENVERYMLLQREALDKSEVFAEVAQMVTTGHPELDEGRRRPRQDSFSKQLEAEAEDRKREVLSQLFQTSALVMFVDASCSGCGLMGDNFYRMAQTHGLVWQVVSLDGTVLPENVSSNQTFDQGMAAKLGVESGGAVFLATPPNQFVPVTWNATGGAEIADRILLVARRAGIITDAQFRRTLPVNPMVSGATVLPPAQLPDILVQADRHLSARGLTMEAGQ